MLTLFALSYAPLMLAAEEIVVTSTATRLPLPLTESPGAVDVVNVDALRGASAGIDLSEFLSRVPGLNIQHRHNYAQDTQISARGFGARASFGIRGIRIYVDDIPVTIPDGQAQGALIPLAALSQLDILRGPWSLAYGNAAGGVIAATTMIPQGDFIASTRLWRGQDGVAVESLQLSGAPTDAVAGLISWQQFQTDGYRAQSAAKREQLYAKFALKLPTQSTLMLTLNKIDQPLSLDPLGLTATQLAENPRQSGTSAILFNTRKTIAHQQIGAVLTHAFQAMSAKIIAYQGQRQVVQFLSTPVAAQLAATSAGGVIDLDRDFAGVGVRLSNTQNGNNVLQWLFGLDIDSAKDNRLGAENFRQIDAINRILGERGNLRRDETNHQRSADIFVQISMPLDGAWRAYAGMRQSRLKFSVVDRYIRPGNVDDSGERKFAALSPALGVVNVWGAKNFLSTFHLSLGQGFETPTAAEQAYRADQQSGINFNLRASRNRQMELGYRLASKRMDIRATVFAIQSIDEIVSANTVAGRSSFQNARGTSRTGTELAWRWTPDVNWQTNVAWTTIRARLTDDYLAGVGSQARLIRAGNLLPAVPTQNLYADIGWRQGLSGFSAQIEMVARAAMFADDANLAKAAGNARLNARIGYQWPLQIAGVSGELASTIRIENALDRRDVGSVIVNDTNQRFFEPSPARSVLVGLSGKLRF